MSISIRVMAGRREVCPVGVYISPQYRASLKIAFRSVVAMLYNEKRPAEWRLGL